MTFQEHGLNLKEKWLCLDFVNTLEWRNSSQPEELLQRWKDLLAWSVQVGLILAGEAQRLEVLEGSQPAQAEATFKRAIALREAIYRMLYAHMQGQQPDARDLERLNAELRQGAADWKVESIEGGFAWDWSMDKERLDDMLGVIARSAAELLTGEALERVGICANPDGCGWVFYDGSRNRSRRWCSMEDCGNRAKAQRHYQRQKSDAA